MSRSKPTTDPSPRSTDHGAPWNEDEEGCSCIRCEAERRRQAREERAIDRLDGY